jgi:chromosome segregation ATPase
MGKLTVAKLAEQVSELQDALGVANEQTTALSNDVAAATTALAKMEKHVASLEETNKKQRETITALETANKTREEEIAGLKAQLVGLDSRIAAPDNSDGDTNFSGFAELQKDLEAVRTHLNDVVGPFVVQESRKLEQLQKRVR